MQAQFLKKYFPMHRTSNLKAQIQSFQQEEFESFTKCWERFKNLQSAYPHHGFEKWRLMSIFHTGLQLASKQLVETMCDGEFMNLPPDEAESHFEYVSETTQSWDTSDPNNWNPKVRLGTTPMSFLLFLARVSIILRMMMNSERELPNWV